MWDVQGDRIESYGGRKVEMQLVANGRKCSADYQVADVTRDLLSMGKLVNSGDYRVVIDSVGLTLEQKRTGEKVSIEHHGNTF